MHTEDFLLGGRVRHAQPVSGHRTGIEPVLLAASVPARPGQRVLEAGTGSGAALLCLAWRVPGVVGVGLELDPGLAAMAAGNATANGFGALSMRHEDVERFSPDAPFDHALANPPWHDPAGTKSADAGRELARRAEPLLLTRWVFALARCLRSRGTITMVTSVAAVPELIAAFERCRCGGTAVLPLWPRDGVSAKLALVRATRACRAPFRLLPGLALHQADGRFTAGADAILRDGSALVL